MGYPLAKLAKVGKVELAIETIFASVGTSVSYSYLQCEPLDRSSLTWEPIEDMHQRTKLTSVPRIPGAKTGTLTLRTPLMGWSSTLPVGNPGDDGHPYGQLFAWAFGLGQSFGFTTDDLTGSTATTLKAADLSAIPVGQAVAYVTTSLGYQVVWAKSKDTGLSPDEVVLLQTAAAAARQQSDTIYGSFTCAMTDGLSQYSVGVREGFRLRFSGASSDDQMVAYGCVPSGLKLTFERGKLPMLELTLSVAHWQEIGSGGAPTAGTWNYPQPEALMSSWVSWGTTQATKLAVGKAEFDLKLELSPIEDVNAPSGIGGWFVKSRRPTCTFSVVRAYNSEVVDWAAQNGKPFTFTFGTQPGKMFSLNIPNARIVEFPAPEDQDGKMMSKIVLEAQKYSGDIGTDDTANTDCRFAFL